MSKTSGNTDTRRDIEEELHRTQALEALIENLYSPDAQVRSAAVSALGASGRAGLIALVAQAASDSSADVRLSAVRALGMLGADAPIAVLETALHDADPDVRLAAAEALRKLSEPAPEGSKNGAAALLDEQTLRDSIRSKLELRTSRLQQLASWLDEDPGLERSLDDMISKRLHESEIRQRRLAIIGAVITLIIGWLLSALGTPVNLAHLFGLRP